MNKKAGTKLILKMLVGLVIAIAVIVVLLNVMDKFILFGKDEPNQQIDFFNELNNKIETTNPETQLFQLEENKLLISFNNQDSKVNLKDIEEYTGNRKNQEITIKKPLQCIENCLCLCITEDDNILFEDDCLQKNDICAEHKKQITQNSPFILFGEGIYNLKIEKQTDKTIIRIGEEAIEETSKNSIKDFYMYDIECPSGWQDIEPMEQTSFVSTIDGCKKDNKLILISVGYTSKNLLEVHRRLDLEEKRETSDLSLSQFNVNNLIKPLDAWKATNCGESDFLNKENYFLGKGPHTCITIYGSSDINYAGKEGAEPTYFDLITPSNEFNDDLLEEFKNIFTKIKKESVGEYNPKEKLITFINKNQIKETKKIFN